MNEAAEWAIAVAGGYLAGSIPFGLLMGLARGVDIRKHGSGNIGATNCGRVLGRRWGMLCFVLDALKGAAPVVGTGFAFRWIGDAVLTEKEAVLWLTVGGAAVLGQVFPVWLGFRGGKGVATGFGATLGVWPYLTLPALGAAGVWAAVVLTTRYVGLSSVLAAVAMPLLFVAAAVWEDWSFEWCWPFVVATSAMAVLIVVRHRSNLVRLWHGTEPRFGRPKVGGSG